MYILDTQNIFNFVVEATGRQNLFTVKSDIITLYYLQIANGINEIIINICWSIGQ